jgi:hypothetical protein
VNRCRFKNPPKSPFSKGGLVIILTFAKVGLVIILTFAKVELVISLTFAKVELVISLTFAKVELVISLTFAKVELVRRCFVEIKYEDSSVALDLEAIPEILSFGLLFHCVLLKRSL